MVLAIYMEIDKGCVGIDMYMILIFCLTSILLEIQFHLTNFGDEIFCFQIWNFQSFFDILNQFYVPYLINKVWNIGMPIFLQPWKKDTPPYL